MVLEQDENKTEIVKTPRGAHFFERVYSNVIGEIYGLYESTFYSDDPESLLNSV